MSNHPFVSIIIPIKEINHHLTSENLPELDKQTYKNYEVLVLPNKEEEIDKELLKKYRWLKIIPTGKVTRPAEKRDIGVKKSKGEIIAFIDDDAYPTPSWLEHAVKVFQEQKIAAVCGPGVLPPNSNLWEKIFDEVLKNPMGSGNYRYRFVQGKKRYVDDYPSMNFFIQKNIFEKLGGFNNDYWPGEDSKLCNDLVHKEKGKILYDPKVVIYHHRRNNLKGYLRQHGNYGFHRGAFFAQGDQNSRRLSYLMPTFFVAYLILLISILLLQQFFTINKMLFYAFLIPFLMYLSGEIIIFFLSFWKSMSLIVSAGSILVIAFTHITYGIMFVKGYIRGKNRNKSLYD